MTNEVVQVAVAAQSADWLKVITAIGAALAGLFAPFWAFKTAQLKTHVNSQLDEFKRLIASANFAEGKVAGKLEQKEESRIEILTQVAAIKPLETKEIP